MSLLGYDSVGSATINGLTEINANNVFSDVLYYDAGTVPVNVKTAIGAIDIDVTVLEGQMVTANANISTLQGQMTTANSNISTLQGQMTTANSNISTLQGQYSTLNGEVNTLQSEMNTAQSDINTLQSEMNDAQSDIGALYGITSTTAAAVAGLSVSQAAQDVIITAHTASIAGLNGDVNALENDVTALQVKTTDQSWASLTRTTFSGRVNVGGGSGVVLNTGSASEFNSGIVCPTINSSALVCETSTGDMRFTANGSLEFEAITGFWIGKSSSNFSYNSGVDDYYVFYGNQTGTTFMETYINGAGNLIEFFSSNCKLTFKSNQGVALGQGTDITEIDGSEISIRGTDVSITGTTYINTINSLATNIGNTTGTLTINSGDLDITATGAYTLDATTYTMNTTALTGTAMTWGSNTSGSDLILDNPTAGAFSIEAGLNQDLIFNATGTGNVVIDSNTNVIIDPTQQVQITGGTGTLLTAITGDLNIEANGVGAELNIAGTKINVTGSTDINYIGTQATRIGNATGQLTLNSDDLDINATGTASLDATGIAINATSAGIQTFATTSSLFQSTTTTTLTSGGETEINCTDLDINATGVITIDTDDPININSSANGINLTSFGEQDITCGSLDINSSGVITIDAVSNTTITSATNTILGTTNVNTTGTAATSIGNTTGAFALTGSTNTILGTTNINRTGTLATSIGNTTGAFALTGSTNTILGTTNINRTGTEATSIGNASAAFALTGSTNTILGTTNINAAGNLATNIGNSAGNLALTGNINTVLGTTNINRTGGSNTSIGNTGTITLTGSTLASTTTGNSTITSSAGDVTLSGTDVFINTTGTGVGEFVVRANTNVDIKANNGDLELNALTTMLITSGGTQTVFVDTANKMVTSSTTTTLTNNTINLEGNTNVNVDNTFNMMPTATIIQNLSSTVPAGFLYCNGGNISRTTYSRLFSAIGTAFGAGDGLTTFGKPDFQGSFLKGFGTQTVGGIAQTGASIGTAQNQALQDHKHTYSDMMWWDTDSGGGSGQTIFVSGADYQAPGGDTVGSNGDGNFANRLTKATWPANAVNPGTPAQQWNTPTNVSAFTGSVTHPMNYSVYYYIRY
jgi:hypothetical protein